MNPVLFQYVPVGVAICVKFVHPVPLQRSTKYFVTPTLSVAAVQDSATDDEPCDVVFAGEPERAFVSCSQANTVLVFDLANLDAPPQRLFR